MSRAWICAVIMAVTASASAGASYVLRRSAGQITGLIDEVISSAQEGREADTVSALDRLEDRWQQSFGMLSLLVQRGQLTEISYNTAKLRGLFTHGADDFIAECEGIKEQVKRLVR